MSQVQCLWDKCGLYFDSEEAAFTHLIKDHTLEKKQKCEWRPHPGRPLCALPLRNKGNFADHVVTHFSSELRPIQCQLCPERLRNRQDVKRHEAKHTGKVPERPQPKPRTSLKSDRQDSSSSGGETSPPPGEKLPKPTAQPTQSRKRAASMAPYEDTTTSSQPFPNYRPPHMSLASELRAAAFKDSETTYKLNYVPTPPQQMMEDNMFPSNETMMALASLSPSILHMNGGSVYPSPAIGIPGVTSYHARQTASLLHHQHSSLGSPPRSEASSSPGSPPGNNARNHDGILRHSVLNAQQPAQTQQSEVVSIGDLLDLKGSSNFHGSNSLTAFASTTDDDVAFIENCWTGGVDAFLPTAHTHTAAPNDVIDLFSFNFTSKNTSPSSSSHTSPSAVHPNNTGSPGLMGLSSSYPPSLSSSTGSSNSSSPEPSDLFTTLDATNSTLQSTFTLHNPQLGLITPPLPTATTPATNAFASFPGLIPPPSMTLKHPGDFGDLSPPTSDPPSPPAATAPAPPAMLLDPREDFWNRIHAAEKAAIAYHNLVGVEEVRGKRSCGEGWGGGRGEEEVDVDEEMDGEDGKKKEVLGEHESIMTLKKDPTMICTRGTSPVFVQNVCFTVQSLTTNPLPSDLLNSITSMMSRGGYVPSILICHLWIHLLRSLPLPKFESLFPHMFTTSVTRPMIRRAIIGSLIRGECTGRRREEALKGGRELAELVRTTCNNEDVWSVKEMDDGFKVDVEILSTDVPGTEGREVCFEALAVKKLLYSLFIRGLDADFQREGAYNGKKVSMRWIDSDYGSKFAVVRVVYSALSNTSIVENTPVPDLTLQKMAVAI